MSSIARDLIKGAVDLHIHTGPDILPRLLDDEELARSASEMGMAAIVLKSHHLITADRAKLAQKHSPGAKVFGGLALNLPSCGGLNPDAVRVAIRMDARILWLPTLSAAHHIETMKTRALGNLAAMSRGFSPKPVEVLDENGAVLPELQEILAQAAEADIILATGHLSVPEIKVVVDAAVAAGVRKILVNHPELWLMAMSIEDQRELAAKGAMLERCLRSATTSTNQGVTVRQIAEEIRAVGAASTVMSTDYGQKDAGPAAEGMLEFIEAMLECGISPEDVEMMAKVNPAKLLGI